MIKKTLLALTILATTSQADTELHFGRINPDRYHGYIYTGSSNMHPPAKDWMGIYKKGTSTAWSNVINWKWVKDLRCEAPEPCHDTYRVPNLPEGDYTMRYFKNNSYVVDGAIDFKVKSRPINLKSIKVKKFNNTEVLVSIQSKVHPYEVFAPLPKDWIGIYKVGTSNAWKNVQGWTWANKLHTGNPEDPSRWDFSHTIKNLNLKAGTYEARYFLNNSYTTYKKSKPFKIQNANVPIESIEVHSGDLFGKNQEKLITVFLNKGANTHMGRRDWVGVYEKGASSSWRNIKAWAWAKNFTVGPPADEYPVKIYTFQDLPLNKTYEIRYFINNSYTVYKKTTIKR